MTKAKTKVSRLVSLDDVVVRTSKRCEPEISSVMRWVAADHVDEGDSQVRRWSTTDDPMFPPTFRFRVPAGSVLVHSRNPNKVATLDFDAITGEKFFCLTSRDESRLLSSYVALQLQSDHFKEYSTRWLSGSVNKFLNWSALARYEFELPSLDEQARVVELLSAIDNHVELLKRQQKLCEVLRKAVVDSHLSNEGNFWPETTLGEVASWGSGGTPKAAEDSFYSGDIPWCVTGDLTEGEVVHTEKTLTSEGLRNSSAKIVEPGTVLISMYGASIGRTGIAAIPMATNQAVAFASPNPKVLDNHYLLIFLQSQKAKFINAGQGAAQPNISQAVLKAWPICLPAMNEQHQLVEVVSNVDRFLTTIGLAVSRSRNLGSSLLNSEVN